MALLPIHIYPDPVLKQKCLPVEQFDESLQKLIDDMFETMYAGEGAGLAASQVGVLKRIIVMDLADEGQPKDKRVFINPEILSRSSETLNEIEGCLSFPAAYTHVKRAKKIKIKYQDVQGKVHEEEAVDWLSICIQHEMDHLEGIVFIEHISSLKRNMVLRRLDKAKRYIAKRQMEEQDSQES
jgi:peptide deformylase